MTGLEAVRMLHTVPVYRLTHVHEDMCTSFQAALAIVYMLLHPIPAFCVLQCVIYGAVSVSKQAKANSPEESLQMHALSSPQCHTHSSPSQHCTKLKPSNSHHFHAPLLHMAVNS